MSAMNWTSETSPVNDVLEFKGNYCNFVGDRTLQLDNMRYDLSVLFPAGVCSPFPAGVCSLFPAFVCSLFPAGVCSPFPAGVCSPFPAGVYSPFPAGVCSLFPAGVCCLFSAGVYRSEAFNDT
nr:hypothetical protein BgiMline_004914 [Biomphalaria glabrata]